MALLVGMAIPSWTMVVAFLFKLVTYAASATFHLYPFSSTSFTGTVTLGSREHCSCFGTRCYVCVVCDFAFWWRRVRPESGSLSLTEDLAIYFPRPAHGIGSVQFSGSTPFPSSPEPVAS